jgi:Leucine-rich repeat (LRR) protein
MGGDDMGGGMDDRRRLQLSANAVGGEQKVALMNFYRDTAGHNWATKTRWGSDKCICSWYGIRCEDKKVISVRLPNNKLSGNMDALCSADLTHLKIIHVENNKISTVPNCLGKSKTLRYVNVGGNGIGGSFPGHLLDIPSLRTVDVRNNQMSGNLPKHHKWRQAKHLRAVYVGENSFTGSLGVLQHNQRLHIVDARHNNFQHDLKEVNFCNAFPQIRHFYVHGNAGITGSLPTDMRNCPNLMTLHLANTNVGGSIPADLTAMARLQIFNATNTQISGDLPPGGIGTRHTNHYRYIDLGGTSINCPPPPSYDFDEVGCPQQSLLEQVISGITAPASEDYNGNRHTALAAGIGGTVGALLVGAIVGIVATRRSKTGLRAQLIPANDGSDI